MNPILTTTLLAFLFYICIPGIGAFYVRSRWRIFRKRIIQSSLLPLVDYRTLRTTDDGLIGHYRFFGVLEAIQGENIWIRNETVALSADLKNCSVYVLPQQPLSNDGRMKEHIPDSLPDEEPERINWNKIFSLPAGTKIFLSGALFSESGQRVFRDSKDDPLMVVIYDGPEETILYRSIWTGRQYNEYWNVFTPGSVTAGSFSLFIQAYTLFREPLQRFSAIVSLTTSLIPLLIFIPPGVLLFFLFRRLWRRGRVLRAERDLLQMPLRYFPSQTDNTYTESRLPDGEPLAMWRVTKEKLEQICSVTGNCRVTIRSSSMIDKEVAENGVEGGYYLFGTPRRLQDNTEKLIKPGDPMAEYLVVPGDPARLSAACARRAHMYELVAAVTFVFGLLINISIAFFLFMYFIK